MKQHLNHKKTLTAIKQTALENKLDNIKYFSYIILLEIKLVKWQTLNNAATVAKHYL